MAKIIVEFKKASTGKVTVQIDGEVDRETEDPAVVSLALAVKKMVEVKIRTWIKGFERIEDQSKGPTTPAA